MSAYSNTGRSIRTKCLIVWDKGSEGYIATNPEVNARLVENAELLVDDEGLLIYRLPANPY